MNTLHLSTSAFRDAEATEGFREVFGRSILQIEIAPLPGRTFSSDLMLRALPGVATATGTVSPVYCRHLASRVDNDDLVMVFMKTGVAELDQRGRKTQVLAGDVAVTSNGEPATMYQPLDMEVVHLRLSRKGLMPGVVDIGHALRDPVLPDGPALRLLRNYLEILGADLAAAPASVQQAAASHIQDLATLALGATRDAAEVAKARGVRAARLHAIKKDIIERLSGSDLSLDQIARLHRISTSYIRQLFAAEDTTFTQFVLDQRLRMAHRRLEQQRFFGQPINRIAFDCGFSDLSYFNRSFRRRFGRTPSDVRQAQTSSVGHTPPRSRP